MGLVRNLPVNYIKEKVHTLPVWFHTCRVSQKLHIPGTNISQALGDSEDLANCAYVL